jgi:hypothetical protein
LHFSQQIAKEQCFIDFYPEEEDVPAVIKRFFERRIRCVPKCCIAFTNMDYFPQTEHLISSIDYPVVVLQGAGGLLCPPAKRTPSVTAISKLIRIDVIMASFLNRHFTDFEVLVTDWNNPNSVRPASINYQYPIKCVLVFFDPDDDAGADEFKEFISSLDPSIPVCGGSFGRISYYIHEENRFNHESGLVTVTLAGENVGSAELILSSEDPKAALQKLTEFKQSLPFNPDQRDSISHTVGFFFLDSASQSLCAEPNNILLEPLHEVFPDVVFTGAKVFDGYVDDFLGLKQRHSSHLAPSNADITGEDNSLSPEGEGGDQTAPKIFLEDSTVLLIHFRKEKACD